MKEMLDATLVHDVSSPEDGRRNTTTTTTTTTTDDDDDAPSSSTFTWPEDLNELLEGMPQAATLVSRMKIFQQKNNIMTSNNNNNNNKYFNSWLKNPLDHIYIWYDCLCLPQNFESKNIVRNPEQKYEFSIALQNLDRLVQRCELLCLLSTDYYQRAWCSFEHFQKSISSTQAHIFVPDPTKVLQNQKVDWKVVGQKQQVDKNQKQVKQKAEEVMATLRREFLRTAQIKWKSMMREITMIKKDEKKKKSSPPPPPPIQVCDLSFVRTRIENTRVTPTKPPLIDAMNCLCREIYTAVFTMSCRDAAKCHHSEEDFSSIEANFNNCPDPNHIGIHCGLHDHRLALPVERQRTRLQELANNDGWMMPEKYSGNHGVEGEVKRRTGTTLCKRRVTIDFSDLAASILERFRLKCTNSRDVAFVGLLALRNILELSSAGLRRDGDDEDLNRDRTSKHLRVSAGCLAYVSPVIRQVVSAYSEILANGKQVSSLKATICLEVPRWVLLDMSSSQLPANTTLELSKKFMFGKEAQKYFQQNPAAVYGSIRDDECVSPMKHHFCNQRSCIGGWARCAHDVTKNLMATVASMNGAAVSTLDPWATTQLPMEIEKFVCVNTSDRVFVIGGLNGQSMTTCLNETYYADLPLSAGKTTWKKGPNLTTARRNAAGCLQKDKNGKTTAILVAGGRGTATPTKDEGILRSVEILKLSGLEDATSSWKPFGELPHARSGGHIVAVDDALFAFGGRSKYPETADPDAQTCDILCISSGRWFEGPIHPDALYFSSLVVIRDRFVFVFGGQINSKAVQQSWVLDLKPWVDWICKGSPEDQCPASTWMPGPTLPRPMGSPNVCLASQEETGLPEDWIIAVAPIDVGSYTLGMQLPPAKTMEHPNAIWHADGINIGSIQTNYRWTRLANTPDTFTQGASIVAGGVLGMLGGISLNQGDVTRNIHFRQVAKSGTILPIAKQDDNSNHAGDPRSAMLRRLVGKNQDQIDQLDRNQRIQLNDMHLIGRLGFPLEEQDLFAPDGTKMLQVVDPEDKHCQWCLASTKSLETARSRNDVAMYGIQSETPVSAGPASQTRMVYLCSKCLCEVYYNQNRKERVSPNCR